MTSNLMKWIACLSSLAILNLNVALRTESPGHLTVASAVAGFCLSTVLPAAYELGASLMKG